MRRGRARGRARAGIVTPPVLFVRGWYLRWEGCDRLPIARRRYSNRQMKVTVSVRPPSGLTLQKVGMSTIRRTARTSVSLT